MPSVRQVISAGALAATAGAMLLAWRRGTVGRALGNARRYSAPSVESYDSFWARLLGGFYERVARETSELTTSGSLLDVGSGPGHLAVALARAYPTLQVVGVDVSPEMVSRARTVAERAGVGARVRFEHGDVSALPFHDESFDSVLTTFSMHHWPDPARGLAEIHRVLKPGASARIYDLASWISRIERRDGTAEELVSRSPFGGGQAQTIIRLGPLPIVRRIELRRGVSSSQV